MIYYDRIDVYEGIDVNKTSASKSTMFVTIGISKILVLSFKQMPAMDVMVYL